MALDPTSLPRLAAGASMLALAGVLLRYGAGRAPNWLLAFALLMHAASSLIGFAAAVLQDPEAVAWMSRTRPYFQLAIAPAFIAFAMYYPRPRSWGRADPLKPWALGALVLAGPLAHLLRLGDFDVVTDPLRFYFEVLLIAYGVLAYILLREWSRTPTDAPLRTALLATSLAFALIHIYDAVVSLGVDLAARGLTGTPPTGRTLVRAGGIVAFVPFFLLLAREARAIERELRVFMPLVGAGVVLGAVVVVAAIIGATTGASIPSGAADTALRGLFDLTFPVILTLAVLRHQLLDIDVKLRWTISKSTIAAAFVAAFFLLSEGAQLLLGQENAYVGLLGAAALVFAMAPLQRAAERLAERAVPMGAAQPTLDPSLDPEAAYRAAVRLALRDRVLTREEERQLLRLAHHAGISAPRALAIHDEVEAEGAADAPKG